MKFKADENLPPPVVERLSDAGHDVETVRSEGLSGASDEALFRVAADEGRALVTLDLDFSNPLRFSTFGTAGIVVLRVPRPSRALRLAGVGSMLQLLGRERLEGRLWIVEHDRVRVHTPSEEEP